MLNSRVFTMIPCSKVLATINIWVSQNYYVLENSKVLKWDIEQVKHGRRRPKQEWTSDEVAKESERGRWPLSCRGCCGEASLSSMKFMELKTCSSLSSLFSPVCTSSLQNPLLIWPFFAYTIDHLPIFGPSLAVMSILRHLWASAGNAGTPLALSYLLRPHRASFVLA